ncbi:sulfite exporter TauE/SafE family protein [Caldimonas brevitalea]|uniref:Urease accessory protein UreH-like transmembrane domain-containing protein n=1 Tax=Caldimonas brevitalea TaxID=413882 RepID=A0A0G3BKZ5_9BURK|nr:sulfite exporter TauE/SafE family protein [Caldimonas brevitalea]AKJ28658.1 hypothetical protein AAW51_1967 [Caldimonas brevitalea]
MQTSLFLAALLMGVAGSPHCATMCGAATAGIGCTPRRLWAFQAGRVVGYALFGLVIASSAQALQWGAREVSVLKPFWAMWHVAVVVLGLVLLWTGRQPAWLDRLAHRVWQSARHRTLGWDGLRWPFFGGLLWTLLPCGLLYSALMVAALASRPWEGALVMAVFALGSALSLHLGATVWRRLRNAPGRSGGWAIRAGGLVLASASAVALAHGLHLGPETLICT